jgi:hypothetical protein
MLVNTKPAVPGGLRNDRVPKWAWVDSDLRPHACQTPITRAKSRHLAVLFKGRTHDLPFLRHNMPESAGIIRSNDRPKLKQGSGQDWRRNPCFVCRRDFRR